jgi:ABC-type bacteriocin/lantibiotic exporter with double-glycine peptidase domain
VSAGDGHHASPFSRLVALLRLERSDVTVALIYGAGVGVLSLAAPVGVQALVNAVAFGGLVQPVVVLTVLVFGALAFAAVLRALQAAVVERVQERIFARVALDLGKRLPRVRFEAFDGYHGPELVNRFFDVLTVQKVAATLLVDGASIVLAVVVGTLILAFYHPLLLAFDVGLVGLMLIILFALGRGGVKTSIVESKAKYALVAWLEEMARHPSSFRGAGGGAFAEQRADELTRRYLDARRGHFRVLFRQMIGSFALQALSVAALLGVGGVLVVKGDITLGQLVAAELIVTAVTTSVAKLGKYLESYYDLCAAVDKLGHLTDLPLEPNGGAEPASAAQGARVRIHDVAFGYAGGRPVLTRANLEVPAGGRVAVIGPNGSGKSTLADLIYGLRYPDHGRVEIDGVDLRDLDLAAVRAQIALVRGVEIFEGTVAENVGMNRPGVDATAIREALSAVFLLDDHGALPDGLSTRLTTGGASLSAGQARRLVIARAIAGRPRMIIVDESLDDLDPETRRCVAAALFSRERPWSVLVTTHDRDALRGCDRVFVVDGGALRPMRPDEVVISPPSVRVSTPSKQEVA